MHKDALGQISSISLYDEPPTVDFDSEQEKKSIFSIKIEYVTLKLRVKLTNYQNNTILGYYSK